MQKNHQSPEAELPIWFDGKNINEALFCGEFLRAHRIIFTNRAFFTPDGRVTDDLSLRGEIYEELKCCAVNGIPQKIGNILEVLKLKPRWRTFLRSRIAFTSPMARCFWMEHSSRADRRSFGIVCQWPIARMHSRRFYGFGF